MRRGGAFAPSEGRGLANLRKLLAGDVTGSSLKASPIYEMPLDRIYALGTANRLGAALWRLKYAHDPSAHAVSLAQLSLRCKSVVPTVEMRFRLCRTVLQEWLDDTCRKCGGRKFSVSLLGVRAQCGLCEGTGLRRYSDQWRTRQMGFDARTYYQGWERRFAKAHEVVADADYRAWREIAASLGHLPTPVEEEQFLAKYTDRAKLPPVIADDEGAKLDYMPESLVSSAAD
jgi:ribosomal protein L37E